MSKGLPEQVAFGMSRQVRLAALIVLGQSDGGQWDYANRCWAERK
jgi:hypothetical protein